MPSRAVSATFEEVKWELSGGVHDAYSVIAQVASFFLVCRSTAPGPEASMDGQERRRRRGWRRRADPPVGVGGARACRGCDAPERLRRLHGHALCRVECKPAETLALHRPDELRRLAMPGIPQQHDVLGRG